MGALKKIFNVSALALGGAGMVSGGMALLTGGWDGGNGWDWTTMGIALTVLSTGLFYAGYRGTQREAVQAHIHQQQTPK